MSGIAHAVHKVVHGIVGIWHKIWKPLVIAAAIYFTGGAALGALGAMSAGGSVLAGAGAGLSAAAGGIGIGAGAGIGSAFAAGAGTVAAEGAVAGGLGAAAGGVAAEGAVDAGTAIAGGADIGSVATAGIPGATGAVGAVGADSAIAGGAGLGAFGGAAGGVADVGAIGTAGIPGAAEAGTGFNLATAGTGTGVGADVNLAADGSVLSGGSSSGGGILSNSWEAAKNGASWLEKHPTIAQGLFQGASGIFRGMQQADMMNQQMKWADAHAPGQLGKGGVPNLFGNTPYNSLLTHQGPAGAMAGPAPTPMPQQTGQAGLMQSPYAPLQSIYPQQPGYMNSLTPQQRAMVAQQGLMGPGDAFMENPYNENDQQGYA